VPVDTFAADEQSACVVDVSCWVELAQKVLEAQGIRGDVEVSLLFVDETAIAELNSRFLGREGPTDVLAFPIDEDPGRPGRFPDEGGSGPGAVIDNDEDEMPLLLGDVVVCPAVATRNAREHGVGLEDELALLVVHGLLHLCGMDHVENPEAERMERREQELLGRFYRTAP
jgi:probable rRNA maturation factor